MEASYSLVLDPAHSTAIPYSSIAIDNNYSSLAVVQAQQTTAKTALPKTTTVKTALPKTSNVTTGKPTTNKTALPVYSTKRTTTTARAATRTN